MHRVMTQPYHCCGRRLPFNAEKDGKGYYIRSMKGERVSGHCPSVDVMFDSVADVARDKAIGVILTGMGADGARGLTKMRKAGPIPLAKTVRAVLFTVCPWRLTRWAAFANSFRWIKSATRFCILFPKVQKEADLASGRKEIVQ